MPRRGFVPKREVLPDPMYNSIVVTKLINNVMYDGKKGVAQKIVYDAFEIVKEKTGKDPLETFEQWFGNPGYLIGFFGLVFIVWVIMYIPFIGCKKRISS